MRTHIYPSLPTRVSALIAAIILAAGASKRMGKPKQTLPLGGKPMLETVLETFRRTRVDQVFVVLGAHQSEVLRTVKFKDEVLVPNPEYSKGLSSSLKAGLAVASVSADAAIVALADQPFLSSSTVDKMIAKYVASRASIVVPLCHGRMGNPVLFDKSLFPEIMKIRGDSGAKILVEEHRDITVEVSVEDEGVLIDIDTRQEYDIAAGG